MTPSPDRINAIATFIGSLTLSRVLLALLLAVGAVTVYSLWEQRDVAMVTLAGSPLLFGGVIVSMALMLLSFVVGALIRYVDAQRDTLYRTLRDRITELHNELQVVRLRELDCTQHRFEDQQRFSRLIFRLVDQGVLDGPAAKEFTE